jgi:hypothetical protein
MDSFDLVVDGESVTITEADGSVYKGNLGTPVERKSNIQEADRDVRLGDDEFKAKDTLQSAVATKKDLAEPGIRFQVAGTNLTLGLPVAFDGYFRGIQLAQLKQDAQAPLGLGATPARPPPGGGGGGFGGGGRQVDQKVVALRGTAAAAPQVAGRLVVGGTNILAVQATAVPPNGK